MRRLVAVFVLLLFIVGSGFLWLGASFIYSPATSESSKQVFEVSPGESFYRVAVRLQDDGLVTSSFKMRLLGRVMGSGTQIRVGEYELSAGMTPIEILETLSSGKSVTRPFTVQEGLNMIEIAQLAAQMGIGGEKEIIQTFTNQRLVKELLGQELPSLEGYLFPETYSLTKYTTPEDLARVMVARFKKVFARLPKVSVPGGLDSHQVVILASLIEKETGAPEERPIISSVFHNRLRKRIRLASDPTILYGILDRTGVMPKNIRKRDIREKTRYNTYKISGLPYGPISNPGEESLRAVLEPDTTDYLYFVSRNDGTHVFSRTLKEHNRAVRKYQLDLKMRAGKSWRDRLKK